MDRSEQIGLGVAAAGHLALFAALSAGFVGSQPPAPPPAMTVSLAEDVALAQTAPPAAEPPAASVAPEQGSPEDAAAPAPAEAEPEPAPPAPRPDPQPQPRPAPSKAAAKPAPKAPPQPRTPPKAAAAPAAKPAPRPAARPATGKQVAAAQPRARGAILGNDFLKGLTAERTTPAARGQSASAATMSAQAAADIGSAIQRQVQPCAERQQLNAPGAERIRVTIRLNLNRDGSLAGRPAVVGHTGVDDDNQRYVSRVDDLAIASFVGCSPLRGLPANLYDVPRGWKVFRLNFKLP